MFSFFFYFVFLPCVLSLNCCVIFSINAQRRVLGMVGVLLCYVLLLLVLHFEYIAFVIVIVYIGAISILFLFVILLVKATRFSVFGDSNFFTLILLVFLFLWFFVMFGYWMLLPFKDSLFFDQNFFESFQEVTSNLHTFHFRGTDRFSVVNNGFCVFFDSVSDVGLNHVELEQLGFVLWTCYGFTVVLSTIILVTAILGSIYVLRGAAQKNAFRRNILF